MNTRTIQKTGGKSFSLTLPLSWIERHNLGNKGRAMVIDKKRYVLIIPEKESGKQSRTHCHIDGMTKNKIQRQIIGYYLSGAYEIVVKAKKITSHQRAAVREIASTLIGLECLDGAANQQILRSSSVLSEQTTPEYLDKILLSVCEMYKDTLSYIKKDDKAAAQDIIERDIEIDRLDLFIFRAFNMRITASVSRIDGPEETSFRSYYYHHVSSRMERSANHLVRIARYFQVVSKREKGSFNRGEKNAIERVACNLEMCKRMVKTLDAKLAHRYLDAFEKFMVIDVNIKYKNRHVLNLVIAESLSRINSHIANIARETIYCANAESAHIE